MMLSEKEKQNARQCSNSSWDLRVEFGAGLAMFVLTLLFSSVVKPFHAFAVVWGVLSVALFGYLAFSTRDTRESVLRAGLATAFAVIMLLDVACWSFAG